jgi:hypothetical protein
MLQSKDLAVKTNRLAGRRGNPKCDAYSAWSGLLFSSLPSSGSWNASFLWPFPKRDVRAASHISPRGMRRPDDRAPPSFRAPGRRSYTRGRTWTTSICRPPMPLVSGATDLSAFAAAVTIGDALSSPEDCLPLNPAMPDVGCMRASGRRTSTLFAPGHPSRYRRSDSDEQFWQQIHPHQQRQIV